MRAPSAISPDIRAYHKRHPEFPHEPTANQWFTESQFESYRQLGFLIGKDAIQALYTTLARSRWGV
jgi:hypothetical protein